MRGFVELKNGIEVGADPIKDPLKLRAVAIASLAGDYRRAKSTIVTSLPTKAL